MNCNLMIYCLFDLLAVTKPQGLGHDKVVVCPTFLLLNSKSSQNEPNTENEDWSLCSHIFIVDSNDGSK